MAPVIDETKHLGHGLLKGPFAEVRPISRNISEVYLTFAGGSCVGKLTCSMSWDRSPTALKHSRTRAPPLFLSSLITKVSTHRFESRTLALKTIGAQGALSKGLRLCMISSESAWLWEKWGEQQTSREISVYLKLSDSLNDDQNALNHSANALAISQSSCDTACENHYQWHI